MIFKQKETKSAKKAVSECNGSYNYSFNLPGWDLTRM
jgi:hypothetical protein